MRVASLPLQVAAEAATGEFDNLGDPADLRDLVSSDSAVTEADLGGYSSAYPPLSSGGAAQLPEPAQTFVSGGFASGGMAYSAGPAAPMVPVPPAATGTFASSDPFGNSGQMPMQMSAPLAMERPERASTLATPLHTTQVHTSARHALRPVELLWQASALGAAHSCKNARGCSCVGTTLLTWSQPSLT